MAARQLVNQDQVGDIARYQGGEGGAWNVLEEIGRSRGEMNRRDGSDCNSGASGTADSGCAAAAKGRAANAALAEAGSSTRSGGEAYETSEDAGKSPGIGIMTGAGGSSGTRIGFTTKSGCAAAA